MTAKTLQGGPSAPERPKHDRITRQCFYTSVLSRVVIQRGAVCAVSRLPPRIHGLASREERLVFFIFVPHPPPHDLW